MSGAAAERYASHGLHGGERSYHETNCYVDVVVELLHACDYEPLAMLGHVVAADFEGDQWTFIKPPPADLECLFGVDIHEMQLYRPLVEHVSTQLDAGRTMIVELDAWYLPDTQGRSYGEAHVKTSVAIAAIDVAEQAAWYFHNTGLHCLSGADFRGAFRHDTVVQPDTLPLYAEVVRFDAGPTLDAGELRAEAGRLLRLHLMRRPASNPFGRFAAQLERDLPRVVAGDLAEYHAYAFATARMAGATFELAAAHVAWLYGDAAALAVSEFLKIVDGCKVLSFRLARRRTFEVVPVLDGVADAWSRAMTELDALVGLAVA